MATNVLNSFDQSHFLLNELNLFLKNNNSNTPYDYNDFIQLLQREQTNLLSFNPLRRQSLNINDRF